MNPHNYQINVMAVSGEERVALLVSTGLAILRIPARDVLMDLDDVVERIIGAVRAKSPLHQAALGPPPPLGEDFGRYRENHA